MTTGLHAWNCREGLKNGRGAVFDAVLRDDDINCEEDWIVLALSAPALKELAEEVESAMVVAMETPGPIPPERRLSLYFSVKASHPKTETPAGAHGPFSVGYTTYHPSLLTPSLEDEPGSRFYGAGSSDFPGAVHHAELRLAAAERALRKASADSARFAAGEGLVHDLTGSGPTTPMSEGAMQWTACAPFPKAAAKVRESKAASKESKAASKESKAASKESKAASKESKAASKESK
jgi:hypothetical protein